MRGINKYIQIYEITLVVARVSRVVLRIVHRYMDMQDDREWLERVYHSSFIYSDNAIFRQHIHIHIHIMIRISIYGNNINNIYIHFTYIAVDVHDLSLCLWIIYTFSAIFIEHLRRIDIQNIICVYGL